MGKGELNIFKYLYQNGNSDIREIIRQVLEQEMIKRRLYRNNCRESF